MEKKEEKVQEQPKKSKMEELDEEAKKHWQIQRLFYYQ